MVHRAPTSTASIVVLHPLLIMYLNFRIPLLVLAGVLVLCTVAVVVATVPPAPPPPPAYRVNLSNLKLPDTLSFCGEPVPLNDRDVRQKLERELLVIAQDDGQVILYIKRSATHFPTFEKVLKEEEAPEDLKYLSVAESALYMAQSSKGAVGLWQFIPATGQRYGLQIDDSIDERRNVEKSTRAAARYLKDNQKIFKSWTLSAAAYNMGEAALADDIRFQRRNSYFDLYLNEETSRYLYRILAIKLIMSNPSAWGIVVDPGDTYAMPETESVEVKERIPDLAAWAAEHDCRYKDVKLLNPWILRRALPAPPAGRSWTVLVPEN